VRATRLFCAERFACDATSFIKTRSDGVSREQRDAHARQPLDAPPEPPEPLDEFDEGADDAVLEPELLLALAFDEELSLDDEEPDDDAVLPVFGDDAYKSAYQPPPFKMNVPPEICRFAVDWWHFGHCSRAASEIF